MITLELGDGALTNFLNQVPVEELIKRVESKGFHVITKKESSKYVNIERSMGTEPFYDMLVEAIDKGELNLELLVGKVAISKLIPKEAQAKKK